MKSVVNPFYAPTHIYKSNFGAFYELSPKHRRMFLKLLDDPQSVLEAQTIS